jgi:hypothetical protein
VSTSYIKPIIAVISIPQSDTSGWGEHGKHPVWMLVEVRRAAWCALICSHQTDPVTLEAMIVACPRWRLTAVYPMDSDMSTHAVLPFSGLSAPNEESFRRAVLPP